MDLGTDWIIDNQGPSVEEAPAAATAPPAEEMEKRKSVDGNNLNSIQFTCILYINLFFVRR